MKNFSADIFLLYRNEPSVIVGKHQNTLAELDVKFIDEHGITVVRRLSGGGAVYHDLGNLNFTFIKNGTEGKLVDFKGFTKPIIDALSKLGVNAKFQGHNSLMVNGKKISGNAEHVYRKRVMHHGTLLFASNLEILARVLYVDMAKYSDKAVKSVRAVVTNLSDHLPKSMDINSFAEILMHDVKQIFPITEDYFFTESDVNSINHLIDTKYSTWEWNFGYSPVYSMERTIETMNHGKITIAIRVEKGVIEKMELKGSGIEIGQAEAIRFFFEGKPHHQKITIDQKLTMGFDMNLLKEISDLILI